MRHYKRYLHLLVVGYIAFFSTYSIIRHWSYLSSGYDLGIFMQSLWTTANGEGFFFNTGEWQDIGAYSHFGVHNQPILFLLVPIYKIAPYAETLLFLQTVALGFGAITLFKFSKFLLKDERKAFYISVMYLFNPLIHGINRFDFHPVSLVVPFIFLIPYYIEQKKYLSSLVVSLIVLSAKEDTGLLLISLGGMYVLMKYNLRDLTAQSTWQQILKENKFFIVMILIGIAWILLSIMVIYHFSGKYPYLEDGPLKRYGSYIYVDRVVSFIFITLISLAFLPLLNLKYFISTLPLWLELLFSNKPEMLTVGYQYPYMLLPMLFIISVYNLADIQSVRITFTKISGDIIENKVLLKHLIWVSFITMLLFSPMFNLMHTSDSYGIPMYNLVNIYSERKSYFDTLNYINSKIKLSTCPVVTQNHIFPHFANQKDTYYIVTPFGFTYIPNNSIVITAYPLPDYNYTMRYLYNYTKHHKINYYLVDTTKIIVDCYYNNPKNFEKCINNTVDAILRECEKGDNNEK